MTVLQQTGTTDRAPRVPGQIAPSDPGEVTAGRWIEEPPPRRTVAALLAAVDDPGAWHELVDRYGRLVWSVARTFRLDDSTTADVTQNVWLRLVEHRLRIREPEQLASWLATTTRHEAIAVLRGRKRESPTDSVQDLEDRSVAPVEDAVVDAFDDARLHADVRVAFGMLPPEGQLLLRLVTAEPKIGYAAIAEIVGRPIGSIGPTRGRLLGELRRHLASLQSGEDQERTGRVPVGASHERGARP
ncbi:sigma-70 family RNA polymerase sigma factor [Nakamurella sp. YIM 132087]|uniref:Sigma-70 family RNA polymerase sigma factor n=1 Tax=Nakamurella alba TaxID=2665158 RepID=A0A7K1FJF5_9ACTN|nr:sigma-70 family RNA polymerase sigma factor [Nakamurella alba]MTD14265.1 sigma-70 family RNA polymerase sigma factor [Nakamurella alba]